MSDISDMMYEQGYHDGYQLALSELNGKKFEKVIRCKDCKHYHNGLCWNVMRRHGLEDDFFCGDGKRKDGDGDG